MNNSLLYYKHQCHKGKDTVTAESTYDGTSKSAEGFGAEKAFEEAKSENMNIAVHWQDGDSTSAKSLGKYFPEGISLQRLHSQEP